LAEAVNAGFISPRTIMIENILRIFGILVMGGVIWGAVTMILWLGSAWLPNKVVSLSVQAFEVSHGEKASKDEARHLTARFVRQIEHIQSVMSADLSNINEPDQIRNESILPKSLILKAYVPEKVDIAVKAFDIDVIGILDTIYRFFDRSDRLQVSMWVNEKIKLFASFKSRASTRSSGPWWVDNEQTEQATIERFAHQFSLDLYKTEVRGLDGLDAKSFGAFVAALSDYQSYVKLRHTNPGTDTLKSIRDAFETLANQAKTSAIVHSYLGSVRSLQNDADAAITAYNRAKALNPADEFAAREVSKLVAAKTVQRVQAAAAASGIALQDVKNQVLPGYNLSPLPSSARDITVAIVGTGISRELSSALGPRLIGALSAIPSERSGEDEDSFGHGTRIAALVAALAPSARILSIKCFSSSESGGLDVVAASIRLATEKHVDVILLPLGGAGSSPALDAAIKDARTAGALVVAAAGNDGAPTPTIPARLPGVLAVGALENSGKRPAPFTNFGTGVLYAPGVDILMPAKDGLAKQSGTSFSAAIAAAIAAVTWGAKPDLSAQQLQELLRSSAVNLGPVPNKPQVGDVRRIDLAAAAR
jgi:tetratricopeptide (TPR) repeat protein